VVKKDKKARSVVYQGK